MGSHYLPLFCLLNVVFRTNSKFTAAKYLHNADTIISRQLENPLVEDAQDLKDNVEDYIKLLNDLMKCVQRKDGVGLQTAHNYWTYGMPQFIQEERNGDIFNKLTEEFNWSKKEARTVVSLIDKAKFLWNSFDTWYKERNGTFRQF